MTEPRCTEARITPDGLTTSWADVPAESEQESLLLVLVVERADGSEVQLGVRWSRDAVSSPAVFAFDSHAVEQRDHEAPETAISRAGGDVRVLFPRSWVDPLVDAGDLHAAAIVTIDGADVSASQLDIAVED